MPRRTKQQGMNGIFRMSSAHAGDIGAVAAYLKKQATAPVWLIGTSMGTFSAAAARSRPRASTAWCCHRPSPAPSPNGRSPEPSATASPAWRCSGSPSPRSSSRTRQDGCDITPAADAPKLSKRLTSAKKVDVVLLDGGDPPRSDPCEAMSQHGFLGIEAEAVNAMAKFVKANSK